MKANVPSLFPNVKVAARVIEYAASKSSVLPAALLQYHAQILALERANFTISTDQGQALSFLAQVAGARRGQSPGRTAPRCARRSAACTGGPAC